jgi:hypothetical protein
MRAITVPRLLAIVLGGMWSLCAMPEGMATSLCDGFPPLLRIGGVCPPIVASSCILEGAPCADTDVTTLQSRVRVTVGTSQICRRFLRASPTYVRFDVEHHLPPGGIETQLFGSPEAFALPLQIGHKAARIDVDNDGKPESIVMAIIPGSGRLPCDAYAFLQVDEGLAKVAGPLTSALATLPGCTEPLPVLFNGRTYFETRTSLIGNRGTRQQLLWQVYEIREQVARKMCEFRYR